MIFKLELVKNFKNFRLAWLDLIHWSVELDLNIKLKLMLNVKFLCLRFNISTLYQAYYQTHKRVQIQLVLYQVLTFVSLFIYNVSMDGQRCFFRIMKAKKAHIKALKIAIGISGQQIKPHTLYHKIWNTYVLSPSS